MSTVTDPYAEALAGTILENASVWIRGLEDVPGGEASVKWHALDIAAIQDVAFETHGPYRITVIVEPVERWDEVTWEILPPLLNGHNSQEVHVSLNGVRARVYSATRLDWHVDPNSHPRNPIPQENSTIQVRLLVDGQTEPKVYSMPPSGKVMLLSGPLGPAITEILQVFPGTEVIPNV